MYLFSSINYKGKRINLDIEGFDPSTSALHYVYYNNISTALVPTELYIHFSQEVFTTYEENFFISYLIVFEYL